MSLLDKLQALRNLPDETDLAVALGGFAITDKGLESGGESMPLAVVREVIRKPQRPALPARTVLIGDL